MYSHSMYQHITGCHLAVASARCYSSGKTHNVQLATHPLREEELLLVIHFEVDWCLHEGNIYIVDPGIH